MLEKWLCSLKTKKFLFITGKGGTGKSAIAAALAFTLSSQGKKVLLVEMSKSPNPIFLRLPSFLDIPSLSHSIQKIPNPLKNKRPFDAIRIDPDESLTEYLSLKLKSSRLANLLFRNSAISTFLHTIPGLTDLICLGKAWHMNYDLTIFDAPSSGHALEILTIPRNFSNLTKVGPIFSDAKALDIFFRNPSSTAILFCAIPEQMPEEETIDFVNQLGKDFPKPTILVNQCFPLATNISTSSMIPMPLQAAANYINNRIQNEKKSMDNYQKLFPETVFFPYFFPTEKKQYPALPLAQYLSVNNL